MKYLVLYYNLTEANPLLHRIELQRLTPINDILSINEIEHDLGEMFGLSANEIRFISATGLPI
jgi:hypothetical protein